MDAESVEQLLHINGQIEAFFLAGNLLCQLLTPAAATGVDFQQPVTTLVHFFGQLLADVSGLQ